jgi:hypothetical protein
VSIFHHPPHRLKFPVKRGLGDLFTQFPTHLASS